MNAPEKMCGELRISANNDEHNEWDGDAKDKHAAADMIEELTAALTALLFTVNVAWECDYYGGVFGVHHNQAIDNTSEAERLLAPMKEAK